PRRSSSTLPAPTYLYTLALHDALPISLLGHVQCHVQGEGALAHAGAGGQEHQVRAVQAVDLLVHGGKAAGQARQALLPGGQGVEDRKSTRLNSSHVSISYAVFCLKKKK